jgi:glutathione synthase/RimK-type ligase-like ATP-grasp enzyme
LQRLRAPYALVDQRRAPDFQIHRDDDGNLRRLTGAGAEIALPDVTGFYLRPYDVREAPAVARAGPGSAEWTRAVSLDESLLCWAEMADAVVVNRPSAMHSNGSKPYQLSLIAAMGFAVPETLVTNDAEELRGFCDRHSEVIYKSASGVRSKVTRLTSRVLRERQEDLAHCPTQFQQYIAGVDYRVHVAGEAVFSCEIRSTSDDYRFFDGGCAPEIVPVQVPDGVAELCREVTTGLGLLVSGIDLRRTAEDRWYCFEVNPSPAFTYYEQYTGQPIAAAIARLLW